MKSIVNCIQNQPKRKGGEGEVWLQVIKNWSLQGKMTDSLYYKMSKAVFYLDVIYLDTMQYSVIIGMH